MRGWQAESFYALQGIRAVLINSFSFISKFKNLRRPDYEKKRYREF